jgi:hypothetical protein
MADLARSASITAVLPTALLQVILAKVSAHDCARAACVARFMKQVADQDALWESYCCADFPHHSAAGPLRSPLRHSEGNVIRERVEEIDDKAHSTGTECWNLSPGLPPLHHQHALLTPTRDPARKCKPRSPRAPPPWLSRGRFQTDGRTDDRTMAAGASVTWTHCSALFEVTWG